MRKFIRNLYNRIPNGSIIMAHHVCDEMPKVFSCIISEEAYRNFVKGKLIVPIYDMLRSIHKKSYVITFDDALDDLYNVVYPLMKERGIPFTAFISASLIDKPGYITSAQLREMADDTLVTIGSHGCTHKHLSQLSDVDVKNEIFKSKEIIENLIGKKIDLIAYPFGDAGKREFRLACQAGYKYGFGVRPRKFNILAKIFMKMDIPRYNLSNETPNPV